MIVDFHCHAGQGTGFTGPWNTSAPIGPYLRRAAAAGIHRTVVFAPFHSDYRIANEQVARIVRRHPDRLIGFAVVHPLRDRRRIAELVRVALDGHGFRGIKVHRLDAPISREICEVARAHRVPVIYDVAGAVATTELLAREFPDVRFVIPHLGSFADEWKAQLAMVDHLARHPNVFADTSGVRRFDLLQQAARRAGPGKLLFGSDGPWLHPGVELFKVRALRLPAHLEQQVLGGNALRLLGKTVPGTPSGETAWTLAAF